MFPQRYVGFGEEKKLMRMNKRFIKKDVYGEEKMRPIGKLP